MKTKTFKLIQTVFAVWLLSCSIPAHASSLFVADSIPVRYAVRAAQLCQDGQYDEALISIEKALQSDDERNSLYTWYVNGFVHKEIYKNKEASDVNSPHRDKAIEAILKARELSNGLPDTYNNNSALHYLLNTYYNDAITLAGNFTVENETEPDKIFGEYEAYCVRADVAPLSKSDFYLQKGMRFYQLWQENKCESKLNEKAFSNLELSVDSVSAGCDNRYNAALVRYSLAQASQEDSYKACLKEIETKELFKETLELLKTTHSLCPNHYPTLQALKNTCLALGLNDDAEHYEQLLKN